MAQNLLSSKLTSCLMYSVEISGYANRSSLQLPILRFLKKLFLLHPFHPTVIIQDVNIPSILALVAKMFLKWLAKVSSMDHDRLPYKCMSRQVDLSPAVHYECSG